MLSVFCSKDGLSFGIFFSTLKSPDRIMNTDVTISASQNKYDPRVFYTNLNQSIIAFILDYDNVLNAYKPFKKLIFS